MAQALPCVPSFVAFSTTLAPSNMAPGTPMKKAKVAAKAMTKGAMADALATACELKKSTCSKAIDSLVSIATTEVTKTGLFSLPGLCRFKVRVKPATKAGKKEIFGKTCLVKAKPARKIVKAFPAAALKSQV